MLTDIPGTASSAFGTKQRAFRQGDNIVASGLGDPRVLSWDLRRRSQAQKKPGCLFSWSLCTTQSSH